jgi:hypothetical protein
VLAVIWNKSTGATLPPTVSAISLEAGAISSDTGYINIRYEFSNFSDCESEDKAVRNKAL